MDVKEVLSTRPLTYKSSVASLKVNTDFKSWLGPFDIYAAAVFATTPAPRLFPTSTSFGSKIGNPIQCSCCPESNNISLRTVAAGSPETAIREGYDCRIIVCDRASPSRTNESPARRGGEEEPLLVSYSVSDSCTHIHTHS